MNEVKNAIATEIENSTTVTNVAQETYVKPAIEVIEMEMEGAILSDSAQDGGYFDRG